MFVNKNSHKLNNFFTFFLLSIVLTISLSVISFADINQYSEKMSISVDVNSYVNIESPNKMEELTIMLDYFPRERNTQKILNFEVIPEDFIQNEIITYSDDEVLEFKFDNNFRQTMNYGISSVVESGFDLVEVDKSIFFPVTKVDDEIRKYLLPTESIDSDDENVIAKAYEIVGEEFDLFIAVSKIGQWVNENIEYSLTSRNVEASLPASEVLEEKNGVCDELTNLFIAMLRSLGVPARFVSGVAYTNVDYVEDNWGGHGWAEVYFPGFGWVPFDVTYGQYGFVDATHVVLNVGLDSKSENNNFKWLHTGTDVKVGSLDVKAKGITQKDNIDDRMVDLEITPIVDNVGFESYQVLKIDITNNNDFYLAPNLLLSQVNGVEILDGNTLNVILKPKETKTLYKLLKINGDFKPNYVYTIPFSLHSIFADNQENDVFTSFQVMHESKNYKKSEFDNLLTMDDGLNQMNILINCQHEKPVYVGDEINVNCKFINNEKKNYLNSEICLMHDCKKEDLFYEKEVLVNYKLKLDNSGSNVLPLKILNKEEYKYSIINIIVNDKPHLDWLLKGFPSNVSYNDKFTIDLDLIKESYSIPKNLKILVYHPNFNKSINFEELVVSKEMQLDFSGHFFDSGKNELVINATYYDDVGRLYSESKKYTLNLVDLSFVEWLKVKFREWLR